MAFGFLNVNKPPGPTSHDIVARIRRGSGERKAGHAGTLDPMAEGVLLVALGSATRLLEYAARSSKQYVAEIELGLETDTYDLTGHILTRTNLPAELKDADIVDTFMKLRGEIMQTPPIYSAVKIGGKSAHSRARAGEVFQIAPRRVVIEEISVLNISLPRVTIQVKCSTGTYVRSLAHDFGATLGCGAALARLIRVASGKFHLDDAVQFSLLEAAFNERSWARYMLPPDCVLDDVPRIDLDESQVARVRNGVAIPASHSAVGLARAYGPDGRFLAVLAGATGRGIWRPTKVFDAPDFADVTT